MNARKDTRKIHIAGPLVGGVQRCTRCKARIDGNQFWQPIFGGAPTGWQEGAEIFARRGGKSRIDETNRAKYADVRPCGRTAKENK